MEPKKIFGTAICAISLWANPLLAQTTVEVNTLKVEGLVVGVPQKIDAAFAAEHGVTVPRPFHFTVPTDRTKNIKVLYAPEIPGYAKYNFATEDNLLRSSLHFIPFALNRNVEGDPLQALANVAKEGFIGAIVDPDKAEIDVTRQAEVGPYQAVEAIGRYAEADGTIVALRVVAVAGEGETEGLLAIINALPETTGMTKVGDIIYVDGSRALGTMRFD